MTLRTRIQRVKPAQTKRQPAKRRMKSSICVNWYVKRLINKGYVKVTHLQRRKLHYFLTPSGLARKVQLTRGYMKASLRVYRELRRAARQALSEVRQAGYSAVSIKGDDEAAEILQLTCLEQNLTVERETAHVPTVRAEGTGFVVSWPDANAKGKRERK